jgi:murein DD-endopeptidase MepM/ murein hydrolase activator NlpD
VAGVTAMDEQQPPTRRALREAERAREQQSASASGAREARAEPAEAPVMRERPPRELVQAVSQPPRVAVPARGVRRNLLSFATLAFVALVTVVTTVPINVLLPPADLAAAYAPEVAIALAEPQRLGEISGGADVPIDRDAFTVTESVKETMKQQLAATTAGRTAAFSNDTGWAVQWPFAWGVPMSDQFGPRVLCDGCEVTMHRGVDFLPGRGAPIQAIADGVVRYVEESDDGLGVHVIIDHQINGSLVSSVYCHMEFGSVAMAEGEAVHVGQLVGTVGDTGFAFGPHLHFEIREGGTNNVDPVAWLESHAG